MNLTEDTVFFLTFIICILLYSIITDEESQFIVSETI